MTYISMQEHIRHGTVPCMIWKHIREIKTDFWHIREEYLQEKYANENDCRDTKMCIQEGLHICSIQEFFCEIHRLYVMKRVEAKYPLIQTRIERESLRILTLMNTWKIHSHEQYTFCIRVLNIYFSYCNAYTRLVPPVVISNMSLST